MICFLGGGKLGNEAASPEVNFGAQSGASSRNCHWSTSELGANFHKNNQSLQAAGVCNAVVSRGGMGRMESGSWAELGFQGPKKLAPVRLLRKYLGMWLGWKSRRNREELCHRGQPGACNDSSIPGVWRSKGEEEQGNSGAALVAWGVLYMCERGSMSPSATDCPPPGEESQESQPLLAAEQQWEWRRSEDNSKITFR